jgi:hypothetical protein
VKDNQIAELFSNLYDKDLLIDTFTV